MNFTRRDYKKCRENTEWRYSEKYIHATMKSGFTNTVMMLHTNKLTLDKTKHIHF